jgi:hypothetical protein
VALEEVHHFFTKPKTIFYIDIEPSLKSNWQSYKTLFFLCFVINKLDSLSPMSFFRLVYYNKALGAPI